MHFFAASMLHEKIRRFVDHTSAWVQVFHVQLASMEGSENELVLVGNPLVYLPFIERLQRGYSNKLARKWFDDTLYICFICGLTYLAFIFFGRKWMSSRPPFNYKRALFLWNVGLAVFSFYGAVSVFPQLVHGVIRHGFNHTTCRTEAFSSPHTSLWMFLFCLSKVLELGDTVFIILHKSHLNFLHWYHHLTVLFFAYYGYGRPIESASEHYFSSINFFVHTIMYSYYALRAVGVRVHSRIALVITVLQILQMFVCLAASLMAYYNVRNGVKCQFDWHVFYFSITMYSSYALLFIHFFLRRYI